MWNEKIFNYLLWIRSLCDPSYIQHFATHCSPLPCVLASMISLMRPEPTLFLAANLTLYQVPQRRLSNLNDRSLELINTSLHSSVLSTEYCSTNPAESHSTDLCQTQLFHHTDYRKSKTFHPYCHLKWPPGGNSQLLFAINCQLLIQSHCLHRFQHKSSVTKCMRRLWVFSNRTDAKLEGI